jgi:hypothetical protein
MAAAFRRALFIAAGVFAAGLLICSPAYAGETAASGAACSIVGTEANDVLIGTEGADVICGAGGNDDLRGLGGDDVLDGGSGNDMVNAGLGDDLVYGGDGDDWVYGDVGDDRVDGGAGRDRSLGGEGSDLCGWDPIIDTLMDSCEMTGAAGTLASYVKVSGVLRLADGTPGTGLKVGGAFIETYRSFNGVTIDDPGGRFSVFIVGGGTSVLTIGTQGNNTTWPTATARLDFRLSRTIGLTTSSDLGELRLPPLVPLKLKVSDTAGAPPASGWIDLWPAGSVGPVSLSPGGSSFSGEQWRSNIPLTVDGTVDALVFASASPASITVVAKNAHGMAGRSALQKVYFGAAGYAADVTVPVPIAVTVVGNLATAEGVPVVGAEVRIGSESSITDSAGAFSVGVQAGVAGPVRILTPAGPLTQAARFEASIKLPAAATSYTQSLGRVSLPKLAKVTVKVKDSAGQPVSASVGIAGYKVDEGKMPVKAVSMWAGGPKFVASEYEMARPTDADGVASLWTYPTGKVTLEIRRSNEYNTEVRKTYNLTVAGAGLSKNVKLDLPKIVRITGTVVTADGQPASGVAVKSVATDVTDDQGTFSVLAQAGVPQVLSFSGTGALSGVGVPMDLDLQGTLTVKKDTSLGRVKLPKLVPATLTVTDSAKVPVGGAVVDWYVEDPDDDRVAVAPVRLWSGGPKLKGSQELGTVYSGADGKAVLRLVRPSGKVHVRVGREDALGQSSLLTLKNQSIASSGWHKSVVLDAVRTIRARGTVLTAGRAPASGLAVSLGRGQSGVTGADGRFELETLSGAQYLTVGGLPEWSGGDRPSDVRFSGVVNLTGDVDFGDLVLPAPVAVSVNVTDASGSPEGGARVSIIDSEDGTGELLAGPVVLWAGGPEIWGSQHHDEVRTGADGKATLWVLPTDRDLTVFASSGTVEATSGRFVLGAQGSTINLVLPTDTVRATGSVLSADGSPAVGVVVESGGGGQTTSGSDGSFSIETVGGSQWIRFTGQREWTGGLMPSAVSYSGTVVIVDGAELGTLSLPAPVPVTVSATDTDGQPLTGAVIQIQGENDNHVSAATLTFDGVALSGTQEHDPVATGADGSVTFWMLPTAGPIQLSGDWKAADDTDFTGWTSDLVVGEGGLNVSLVLAEDAG